MVRSTVQRRRCFLGGRPCCVVFSDLRFLRRDRLDALIFEIFVELGAVLSLVADEAPRRFAAEHELRY